MEHAEGLALLSTKMIDIFFCSTIVAYGALNRAIITAAGVGDKDAPAASG